MVNNLLRTFPPELEPWQIIIPGKPIQQSRPRFFIKNGKSLVYDPQSKYKEEVRLVVKRDLVGKKPLVSPTVCFFFYMPIPKSTRKRDLDLYESEQLIHTNKPDVDNLVKLYLDCLTGFAFKDDSSVALGSCIKVYSPNPRTEIYLKPSEECQHQIFMDMLYPSSEKSTSQKTDSPIETDNPVESESSQSLDNSNLDPEEFLPF